MDYYLNGYQDYVPIGYHSREGVMALQQALNANGAGLRVDGIWGPKTNAAYGSSQTGGYNGGYAANMGVNMGNTGYGGGFDSTGLSALYQQVLGILNPPSISYAMPTRSQLYSENAAVMRPQYDSAIGARQKQTLTNGAEIDIDAASRGMGRSTYVTDVKDRAMDAEAGDIARLESEYAAALAAAVQEQYDRHLANELSAKQYNAQMAAAAQNTAFSYATNLYTQNVAYAQEMAKAAAAAAKKSSTSRSASSAVDFSSSVITAMNDTARSLFNSADNLYELDNMIADIKKNKTYDDIFQKGSSDYIAGYLQGLK